MLFPTAVLDVRIAATDCIWGGFVRMIGGGGGGPQGGGSSRPYTAVHSHAAVSRAPPPPTSPLAPQQCPAAHDWFLSMLSRPLFLPRCASSLNKRYTVPRRCPRRDCQQAFVDFEGCFALTCSRCTNAFCAYCLWSVALTLRRCAPCTVHLPLPAAPRS